jgi:hypothetical protein
LLDAPPATNWEPEREAAAFFRQGQLLYEHGRYADAIEPLETARAMQPGKVFYAGAVLANEWDARYRKREYFYPGGTGISYYSDLELAELVSRLVRQIRDGYEDGSLSLNDIYSHWARPGRLLGAGPGGKDYLTNPASVSTDQIKQTIERIAGSGSKPWIRLSGASWWTNGIRIRIGELGCGWSGRTPMSRWKLWPISRRHAMNMRCRR